MTGKLPKHPIQPLHADPRDGVIRFRPNKIVEYLLDNGGIDLNKLAAMNFDREDREQFAQLIGYSHSGAHELPYFSSEVLAAARAAFDAGTSEAEARADYLRERLQSIADGARNAMAELFGVHPDDLNGKS